MIAIASKWQKASITSNDVLILPHCANPRGGELYDVHSNRSYAQSSHHEVLARAGRARLARQIVEAFPWDRAPSYLIRDNDGAYGRAFTNRVRRMGTRDRPIAPRSPWQNPYAERLIGTLRRECLDHVLIFGEQHLRRVLASYSLYYNEARTHPIIMRPVHTWG
jgi:transposase InsO family protein